MTDAEDQPFPRCAVAARARSDPMWGTAAPAQRVLAVEHPGPWARQALGSVGIRPQDSRALSRAAADTGTRPLLVRRPGRVGREVGTERAWWLVDLVLRSEVRGTWSPEQGLSTAIDTVRRWDGVGEAARPGVLVCTHGIHDTCCSIWGRPVVDALAPTSEDVWECSHVGGDRFAASAVVLPEGACYGGLEADNVVSIVDRHRAESVAAQHLRGLMTQPAAAQAAVAAALRDHGPGGVDQVRVTGIETLGEEEWDVGLAGPSLPGGQVTGRVTRRWGTPVRLTCDSATASAPFAFDVTWIGS